MSWLYSILNIDLNFWHSLMIETPTQVKHLPPTLNIVLCWVRTQILRIKKYEGFPRYLVIQSLKTYNPIWQIVSTLSTTTSKKTKKNVQKTGTASMFYANYFDLWSLIFRCFRNEIKIILHHHTSIKELSITKFLKDLRSV